MQWTIRVDGMSNESLGESADVSDPEVLFLSDGRDGSIEVYFWDSGFQYSDATLSCGIARDGAWFV